ncbi:MAG: 16S rRNA (cytidine(1402)-2'-O)-methyltransferase [Pyrinomonadaceae bacterium]
MAGTLYLVATPIGNLDDITFRAVQVLKDVDVIACEDTRHTRKLLNAYDIKNRLVSYHEHNEAERSAELGELLGEGRSVAIVSDAGTPAINDPGARLVRRAIEIGAKVVPIPGAVAFVSAVIVSGLPTDSIFFGGFLPSKSGERKRRLRDVRDVQATLVFYEAPHRIGAALRDAAEVLGDRQASVGRELTKLHEEVVRGSLSDLAGRFTSEGSRGEFVLTIDRPGDADAGEIKARQTLTDRVEQLVAEGNEPKAALKIAAKERGLARSEAYRILQSEKH